MKLSRLAWLILGIGIFVIAFVGLYMVFLQQGREQDRLNDELASAQQISSKLTSDRADLGSTLTEIEDRSAEVKSRLTRAKAGFPTSVESIEISEDFFSMADANDLDVTKLTSSEPSAEKVEEVTYLVTSFTVEVRGKITRIIDFINDVVTHRDFGSSTVELVTIDVPEPLTDEEKEDLTDEEIEEEEMPSATIELVIYGYEGG